ncbi:unnamed protein product, partial [Mesorhabditis spiculigera]
MCIEHPKTGALEGSGMGFDTFLLKRTLEQFVDDIAEESKELIIERPRFAYAVLVVADATSGEFCQASCIRQLDVDLQEAVTVREPYFDDEIARALRRLEESNHLLEDESAPQADTPPMSPQLTELDASKTMLQHSPIRPQIAERKVTML